MAVRRALRTILPLLIAAWPLSGADRFEETIKPILQANCLPCHDEATKTSGFSVASLESVMAGGARRGAAVTPGDPAGSPLIQLLRGDLSPRMPMGKALAEEQIVALETWIRDAPPELTKAPEAKTYWAFQPPRPSEPPKVADESWVRNDIDRFVLCALESTGLRPAPEASRQVLIRRLYFDLLGLPPEPAAVKAFVEDTSPTAYEDLVESLLKNPHYGERWGKHWLDLARYADTNGYEMDDEFPHAWRYRDYVIDAFNNDKPYFDFVREQIAGDELVKVTTILGAPSPKPEQAIAMTFLRLAPFNRTPISEESRDVLLSEMTSTVGSVFLGLTLGCAKCHDHKYDMVPTKDFYRMKAFFSTVQIDKDGLAAEFYRPGEKEWVEEAKARHEKELEALKEEVKQFQAPLLEKLAASWAKKEAEKAKEGETAAESEPKKEPKKPNGFDLANALSNESNNMVDLGAVEQIFTAEERAKYVDYQDRLAVLKRRVNRLKPFAMGVSNAPGPPNGPSVPATFVLLRGEWNHPGERVEPGFLSAITGDSEPADVQIDRYKLFATRGFRITLADWIASEQNPLTARVMVNRIWQGHFGRGIVASASDFGKNGSQPTHPELLDWLALRFVKEGTSIKAMHRLMLTSAAYRQASSIENEAALKSDPENQLLWRFDRRRLEGEEVRDSLLAISGRLNGAIGGVPVYPTLPKGVEPLKIKGFLGSDTAIWEGSDSEESRKRSVYIFHRRSQYLPLLETFDAPVLNASCDRRRNSVTALQALSMYNGAFANQQAQAFAVRVRDEVGIDPREQARRAFEIAYARAPKPIEVEEALELMRSSGAPDEGLTALCRVILNSSEFLYVD